VVEPLLDAAGIAALREAMTAAGYTSAGLAAARDAGGAEPGSPLDTLLQVFEHGRTIPAERLASALGPSTAAQLATAGITEHSPDGTRAAIYIQPHQDWWVLADLPRKFRPGPLPRDHVLGVTRLPAILAEAVVREPVHSALDLCCGSGVQSLYLSAHAEVVTATDLSPRALTFAATTAALNGLGWQLIRGSLLEPVAGQKFDLVVCNPPFIVGPGSVGYLYRDAGLPGDQLGARLAAAAPGLLNPGGHLQYLAGWVHVTGQDWAERVAGWAAGTGMDAWIIELDVQDPIDYVRMWTPDPGSPGDRAWLSWLREQRIEAVAWGLVTLRHAGRADPVIRADNLAGSEILGRDVLGWFSRQDWLRDHDLLSSRFRAVDGLRLQSTASLCAGSWRDARHKLTTPAGPRRTDQVSDLIVTLITGCDGSLPLGEQLSKLAAQLDIDPAELHAAAIPATVRLVEHHMIEPVPD
jgi:hypothetical protein